MDVVGGGGGVCRDEGFIYSVGFAGMESGLCLCNLFSMEFYFA